MAAKKLMNVHEALEYLENLDVSSEDDLSDAEDFISRGRLFYLQTTRLIETPMEILETPMEIQKTKISFSQTI